MHALAQLFDVGRSRHRDRCSFSDKVMEQWHTHPIPHTRAVCVVRCLLSVSGPVYLWWCAASVNFVQDASVRSCFGEVTHDRTQSATGLPLIPWTTNKWLSHGARFVLLLLVHVSVSEVRCVCALVLAQRQVFSTVHNEVGERRSFMTTLSCSTRLETLTKESHMCSRFWALNLQAQWK